MEHGVLHPPSSPPSVQSKHTHNHDQIRSSPVQSTWQSTWQSNPLLYAVGQLHIVISPRQVLPHARHYACPVAIVALTHPPRAIRNYTRAFRQAHLARCGVASF